MDQRRTHIKFDGDISQSADSTIKQRDKVLGGKDGKEDTRKIVKKGKKFKNKKLKGKEKIPSVPLTDHLKYLRDWKYDREHWSFQKVRQIWLLRHWRTASTLPDEDFDIFLEYLDGLKGGSRQKTVEDAKKVIRDDEDQETYGEAQTEQQIAVERARRIVEALS